jgi:bifunctional NMN adenylyltransferase/nudix hydrolase
MQRPFDIGVMVGRFQHVHQGHEFAINMGLQVCDRMLILVGSSQEKGTVRNPFDVVTRTKMLEAIYDSEVREGRVILQGLPDYSNPEDINEMWGRHVLDNIKQHIRKLPDIFIYGNDERRSEWFMNQLDEVKNITEMIIARERHTISATEMREYMFFDEFDKWSTYANPKLHKHYNMLRGELLNSKAYSDYAHKYLGRPKSEGWTDKPVSYFGKDMD